MTAPSDHEETLEMSIAKHTISEKPEVSIIMVSYNTAQMTVDAIRSVYDTAPDVDFELLVYDNDSTDGSADRIAESFPARDYPSLTLVRLADNVGFAKANNIAAKQARGRYLLLLNPDTIVLKGAVQGLLAFAHARPEARIWGARNITGDGTLDLGSVWGRMTLWSVFCFAIGFQQRFKNSPLLNPEAYGGWDRTTEREVDVVTGCFFLVDADLWQKLDGFDERFFMYAEEADFCRRAQALGARPRFTPDVEIIHYGGASEALRAKQIARLFAAKIALAQKHWPAWQVVLLKQIYLAAVFARWMGYGAIVLASNGTRGVGARNEWRDAWFMRKTWIDGRWTGVTLATVPKS